MTITAFMYGSAPGRFAEKKIDWTADDIRLALATSSYIPDQDAHDYWDDVVANEATGTNWAANGVALGTLAKSYDAANNRQKLTAANLSIATVTVTWRYGIIYDRTPGTDATRPLIGYLDWGSSQSLAAETFALDWSANGAVSFVVV